MNTTLSPLGAEARRRISRIGLAFFLFFAITFAVQLGLSLLLALMPTFAAHPAVTWLLSMVPMYGFAFPVFYLLLRPLSPSTVTPHRLGGRDFFIFFFISYALVYLGNLVGTVINAFTDLFTGAQSSSDATALIEESPLYLVFIFAVVLGPIVEETMFRGIVLPRLLPFGEGFAILVSALLFGLFHGNLSQFVYAFLLGAFFGFLYCRTGRLRHAILLHAAINFVGSILPLLVLRGVDLEALSGEGAMTPEELAPLLPQLFLLAGYGMLVLGAVAVGAYLLYRYRKTLAPREGACLLERGELGRVFLSVGGVLAALTALFLIVLSYL